MVTQSEHKEVVDSLRRIEETVKDTQIDHTEKLGRLDEHLKTINGTLKETCASVDRHETTLQRLDGGYSLIKAIGVVLTIVLTALAIKAYMP